MELKERQYQEIGKLTVNFETLIDEIKWKTHELMHRLGLTTKDFKGQRCMNILLAESGAKETIDKFRAMFYEIFGTEVKHFEKLDLCFKSAIDFCEVRNNLIHRRYFFQYYSENEQTDSKAGSYNHKARSTGLQLRLLKLSYVDLENLNSFLNDLIKLFNGLHYLDPEEHILYTEFFRKYNTDSIKEKRKMLKKYINK